MKKLIVEVSHNNTIVISQFNKKVFYSNKKNRIFTLGYGRYKYNYYWFIFNRIEESCERVKCDSRVYDALWKNKKGEVTSYCYLDITPVNKKEIILVSKDKKLQGIYNFKIFLYHKSRYVRMIGTRRKALRYIRRYELKYDNGTIFLP